MTRALRVENIDEAARCIDPAFLTSPQVVDASMARRIGSNFSADLLAELS